MKRRKVDVSKMHERYKKGWGKIIKEFKDKEYFKKLDEAILKIIKENEKHPLFYTPKEMPGDIKFIVDFANALHLAPEKLKKVFGNKFEKIKDFVERAQDTWFWFIVEPESLNVELNLNNKRDVRYLMDHFYSLSAKDKIEAYTELIRRGKEDKKSLERVKTIIKEMPSEMLEKIVQIREKTTLALLLMLFKHKDRKFFYSLPSVKKEIFGRVVNKYFGNKNADFVLGYRLAELIGPPFMLDFARKISKWIEDDLKNAKGFDRNFLENILILWYGKFDKEPIVALYNYKLFLEYRDAKGKKKELLKKMIEKNKKMFDAWKIEQEKIEGAKVLLIEGKENWAEEISKLLEEDSTIKKFLLQLTSKQKVKLFKNLPDGALPRFIDALMPLAKKLIIKKSTWFEPKELETIIERLDENTIKKLHQETFHIFDSLVADAYRNNQINYKTFQKYYSLRKKVVG